MTTQHTPGPYVCRPNDVGFYVEKISDGIRSPIARLYNNDLASEHGGTIEANARLIAAAPELLAALELCIESDETENWSASHAAHNAARIVVADALGVQRVNHSHGTPEHWIECARAAIELTKG